MGLLKVQTPRMEVAFSVREIMRQTITLLQVKF